MKRKLLHFLSLLIMMIVSTSAWAETVVLSAPSQSVKSHSDADEIIKITDDSNQEGIQVGSGTFSYNGSSYTPMKLSGSRQFNLTYSNDVTINSVKIICTDNKNDQKEYHLGVSSSDRTSIGTFAVKGATPSEFTITDKTGLNADAQFLAIIVVDYTPSSTKTETGVAATGIKVNGAKVNGAAFDSDNTYTLTDSYVLPPTVAVIKTTSYSDSSTKNADVTVTFALNEDKSFHIGKVTIGETEYTIKVPVKALSTTLADVTGSTTWDWTKTGATAIQLSETTYPSKTDEFVLSNLIPSTDNFNSDALKVQTEYAVRDGKYFQGGKIMFHTTVPGTIKVTFSNTGNRSNDDEIRYLYVNGTKTEFGSKVSNANAETDNIAVPAGDVVLTAQMPKQPDVDQYIRLFSIVFTATTGETYSITYNNNGHGTAPTNVESATALPAELPTMTEEGWTFDGWFTNEGLTDAAVAGATLTANTTLYAKWTQNAASEWRDIKLDFTTEESFIRTVTTTQWGVVNTGVAIAENGTPSAVAENADDARLTITGKYHGTQYGMAAPPKFIVPVEGPVKISIGSSYYEGSYTITNDKNEEITTFSSLVTGKLWSRTDPVVVTYIYTGEATTLTITGTGNSYCPYFAVEKYEIPEPKEWRDIKLDFTTEESFIRTVTTTQWGVANTGVAIDEEGTPSAVGIDTNDSRMTIMGKYHGTQYGMASAPKFIVPVEGPVKISIGSSYYEGSYTITNDKNEEITTFSSLVTGKLWSRTDPAVVTYEYKGKATTLTITGADQSYCPYFAVEAIEAPSTKKEKVIYSTEFSDWSSAAVADSYTTDVTTTDKQDITFTLHQTKVDPTSFDETRFKAPSTQGYLIADKNKQGTITTTAFNNITKLTFVHGATGNSRGWGLKVKGDGDSDWVTVSNDFADPAQGQKVDVEINRNNVQLQFYNLEDAQNAYLMSLEIKGMVEVTGESYTVGVAASPAEGGSVTITPKADDYTEGDEVTLTATENFGYDFVNWTNANGEEVSTEAKFKAEVTANETYTANFVQVNTYALNVAVEGGANDYMLSYNPAPTVVEGKKMYEAGTKVTITAAENPILTFNNWSNGETNKVLEVTMNEDTDFTATYSAVDFIVGWDFYTTGGRTRVADFIGNTENEVTIMDMIDASGASKGFYLRPYNNSYEGKTCALNWNALAEKYYYQTKINAAEFKNIKVQSQMLYNYNAWNVQKLEASLDGEAWETITSQSLGGVKNWQDVNGTLPEKYNNQTNVYLRWIPDYTSEIKGTTSDNDGTCLTNVYITADKELVNDGVAPILVSTVPAQGADNASANGKIVLTFDERVKVAESAKATLGDNQLTPAVSGKTVTFEYKGLKYATAYTFTLPANSVADLTDNYMAEAITINFQTKVKPAIEKGLYDVIVTNGEEMKAAIAQANSRADKTKRFRIFVMPGSHKIPVYDTKVTVEVELANSTKEPRTYDEPRTYITGDNISIIGADYETTTITNSTPTETFTGRFGEANISEGIGNNDVFQITAKNTYFQGVTVKTGFGDARGRDIAIQDKGDKTIIKDARLWGYQDTYTNNANGRFYFEGGVVRGRTDYLCGKGDIWFEGVTLQQCGQGGYPIVPSQPKKYGWIFNGCTLTPETADVTCTLGRPWGDGTPIALLINTVMEVVPGAEGWSEMSGGWPKRFAEYNSTTKTGTVIDLSQRKKTFGNVEKGIHENCNNPVLTAEEAAEYSIAKVMGDGDDWDPTALTEQASAPENVSLTGTSLTWDDSNYVFCWAVIKNGNIVDFTTTPSYTVDDKTATWSVRAANEMGGLGEATEATLATGINSINKVAKTSDAIFNIAGQKVSKSYKGIMIKNGKKYVK